MDRSHTRHLNQGKSSTHFPLARFGKNVLGTLVFGLLATALSSTAHAGPLEGKDPRDAKVSFYQSDRGSTFIFEDVEEKRLQPPSERSTGSGGFWLNYRDVVMSQGFIKSGSQVVADSNPRLQVRRNIRNGLASTLMHAYINHIPVALRADDVWHAITSAFTLYATNHSEEMRRHFVSFEGKKSITTLNVKPLQSLSSQDWTAILERLAEDTKANLKSDLASWITPSFSTTTDLDRTVANLTLLAGMQNYFRYSVVSTSGLTRVTLLGTLQDWQDLRKKAERLDGFGGELAGWSKILLPVLDQFVRAYQGDVDADFWQRVVSRSYGGSGPIYFGGWMLAFVPFDAKGKYQLQSPERILETRSYGKIQDIDFPDSSNYFSIEFTDVDDVEYDITVYGGLSQPNYDSENNELSPSIDWAVINNGKRSKPAIAKKAVAPVTSEKPKSPKTKKK